MIQAQGLSRRFGTRTAVEHLSLSVPDGTVAGLLGPNGAGKTTTVRLLTCLLSPDSGSARVAGHDIARDPQAVRRSVGVLTESPGLYKRLSVWRNLHLFAELHGIAQPEESVRRYLSLMGLWDRRHDVAGTLSKGLAQRLALARALVHEPPALFLDEPTAGLDPEAAREVRQLVEDLRSDRRAVVLCTHNLPEAERLCDRIVVLNTRPVAEGTPEELKRRLLGARTVVRLARPQPELADALLQLPFVKQAEALDSGLSVETEEAEEHNPELVRRLVELGAEILHVLPQEGSLEDVYLKLMEGEHAA